jgi:hypothetical protein
MEGRMGEKFIYYNGEWMDGWVHRGRGANFYYDG